MKKPRLYAKEILQERSRDKRREMLSSVPEHLQALVKRHVEVAYESKRFISKADNGR